MRLVFGFFGVNLNFFDLMPEKNKRENAQDRGRTESLLRLCQGKSIWRSRKVKHGQNRGQGVNFDDESSLRKVGFVKM